MTRFLVSVYLTLAVHATALAMPACTPIGQDLPVQATLASAGFFANLTNADHSVRSRMGQLLRQSEASAERLMEHEAGCPRPCSQAIVAIVFQSAPYKTLSDYDHGRRQRWRKSV